MRIAVLTNAFPPDGRGGAERIAFLQADAFACLGHDVRVWAPGKGLGVRGKGLGIERTVVHGMEVMRFPSRFGELSEMEIVDKLKFHLLEDAGINRAVEADIVAWKPDVLLTHNLTGCGMGTARAVQWHKVKWIHTLHDIQLTEPSGQAYAAVSKTVVAKCWYAFWSWTRRKSFGQPDVVISPTQWLLDWHEKRGFRGKGQGSRVVIPNPVDVGTPRPRALQKPATLVYVGRLSEDKGFNIVLSLVKQLDRSLVSKIIIVGDGLLKSAASDSRFELRGQRSPEETRRAIGEADLLIAPSQILENQQTILLEAMAEGTPVVATDVGGTRETLEGIGCPIISAGEGSEAFAKAVIELLGDPSEWKRISVAMQARAKRHDRETYFEALTALL